ncbi:type II secretion system minor pseudopilin GspI [Marinimicrobium koreense]|uniref:type II secretion system minor pseudopilin GspI n=1 Tax=Marinimicrobium koreense TaxID=306545 RepID=UPI003F70B8AC
MIRRVSGTIRRSKGFTLIEVMVALVVVAVALPAFLMLVMSQLDGTAAIRNKTLAFWVAENEMTRLHLQSNWLDDFTLPDQDQGEVTLAGREWRWELSNEALEVGDYGEMAAFRQIEIAVSPQTDPDNVLARLEGIFNAEP